MSHHFHLVLETPRAKLVAGMKCWRAPTPPALMGGTRFSDTSSAGAGPNEPEGWSRALPGRDSRVEGIGIGAATKGGREEVKIALPRRREKTMTCAWLAQRFLMGTKTHLTHLL